MSTTPLSDRITQLVAHDDAANLHALCTTFLDATVGLAVKGLPVAAAGGTYTVQPGDRIAPDVVAGPEGRRYLKVCADPALFAEAWEYPINTTMPGRTVLEIAVNTPSLAGVLICSATSYHSVPLERAEIDELLARGRAPLSPAH